MQAVNGTPSVVDLAERHSQDLDVFLMWGKRTGRLWVRVTHRSSGRTARIEATASNALASHEACGDSSHGQTRTSPQMQTLINTGRSGQ